MRLSEFADTSRQAFWTGDVYETGTQILGTIKKRRNGPYEVSIAASLITPENDIEIGNAGVNGIEGRANAMRFVEEIAAQAGYQKISSAEGRARKLTEAPLGGYELHGQGWEDTQHSEPARTSSKAGSPFTKHSFVSKVDRVLARDPKTEAALRKMFSRVTQDVYLYLVNSPEMELFMQNLDYGYINTKDDEFKLFPEELQKAVLSRDNGNSIQVILTHNEGGSKRHALTPWMIVHRMAHAVLTGNENFSTDNLLDGLEKGYAFVRDQEDVAEIYRNVCTFGSARNNNILGDKAGPQFNELNCELFTQFIVTGKVKFQMPPEVIVRGDRELEMVDAHALQNVLSTAEQEITAWFEQLLGELTGCVFVC